MRVPARRAGTGTPRIRRPSPCGVRRTIREGSASGAVDGCHDDRDGSLRRIRDCGRCEEEDVPEHEAIIADMSGHVEWFSRRFPGPPDHGTGPGAVGASEACGAGADGGDGGPSAGAGGRVGSHGRTPGRRPAPGEAGGPAPRRRPAAPGRGGAVRSRRGRGDGRGRPGREPAIGRGQTQEGTKVSAYEPSAGGRCRPASADRPPRRRRRRAVPGPCLRWRRPASRTGRPAFRKL